MSGPNDKAHAHYSFVAAVILLLAVSWHVSTGPSTLASDSLEFTSAIDVLEEAAAKPLPDISLVIVVGPRLPPPRDDVWASLALPWPQHVRLSSARHWDSAHDQDLPASPEEAVKRGFDSSESVSGTFELIAMGWSSLQPESRPALVLGSNRRAWAFLPCEGPSTNFSSAVAAVGRALGDCVFNDSHVTHCNDEPLCLKPTARGGAQPYHVAAFELAVESPSSISRWPFGAAAAAFLNPALKRLEPALRLRATSRVTLTASIATRPLEQNAPVKEELSIEGALPTDSTSGSVSGKDERTPPSMRAATLSDLASALVHGPASSLAPRDQFVGEELLMYTVAVLPESKQPHLAFRNSKRRDAKTSSTVQESNAMPLNGSISSMLHVDDRYSTTVVVFQPLDDLPSNGSHPSPRRLPAEYLAPVFVAFLGRLRSGLGLPPERKCPAEGVDANVLISCSPLVEGFRGWEVDLLARSVLKRSRAKLSRRAAQVRALVVDNAYLAKDEVEWKPAADKVQSLMVEASSRHADGSTKDLLSSSLAHLEMELARRSEILSDDLLRAVTLVPNEVEFPLEHLLAVYLPMWMPLAMPLIVGLLKPPPPAGM